MISSRFDKRMKSLYENAPRISMKDKGRIVIMSDCHRADGRYNDNFSVNEKITFSALRYYYNMGYTYIELGDGDELWECKDYDEIINLYSNIFWLFSMFYAQGRYYMLYGNHDIVKRKKKFCRKYLETYYCENVKKNIPLLSDINVYESLVIDMAGRYDTDSKSEILLVHGHQGDVINDTFWRLSRWMVRYIWRPLENLGVNNPSVPPVNNYKKRDKKGKVERWSEYSGTKVIAGHTHRPSIPEEGGTYFNCGSLVHPRCITAIELEGKNIYLVKWCVEAGDNGVLAVKRSVIDRSRIE